MIDERAAAAHCACFKARMAARALTRAYDEALRPLDLRVTQFSVLVAISLAGGRRTITELADQLGMERSTLSRNFNPLVRRGLIVLGPERQHRARSAHITDAGRALLQTALPLWAAAQERLRASLGHRNWTETHARLADLARYSPATA
jgi:DNA-binding MarR family transcriptional regulator